MTAVSTSCSASSAAAAASLGSSSACCLRTVYFLLRSASALLLSVNADRSCSFCVFNLTMCAVAASVSSAGKLGQRLRPKDLVASCKVHRVCRLLHCAGGQVRSYSWHNFESPCHVHASEKRCMLLVHVTSGIMGQRTCISWVAW